MVSMQGSEFQSYHGMTGKVSIDYARDDDTEGDTVWNGATKLPWVVTLRR
jgi:phage tail tube protein FII